MIKTMKPNVGSVDRIGRILVALVLFAGGVAALAGYWDVGVVIGGFALLGGAVFFVTGASRRCPIYEMVGIDTSE